MTDLAIAELLGGRRFHQVVDAGAAAADLGLAHRQQLEAGNRAEQIARRLADALRVREMAGIVVGDAQRRRLARRGRRTERGQHLADVAHPGGERAGAVRPLRVAGQQLAVLLHRRTASGGVHGDDFDARPLERGDCAAGKAPRFRQPSRMQRERAAASLSAGRDDVAAFGRQHSYAGGVDVREHHPLDAPGEQTNGKPRLADCRRPLGQARGQRSPRDARSKRQQRAQARSQCAVVGRRLSAGRLRIAAGLPLVSGTIGIAAAPLTKCRPEHERRERDAETSGVREEREERAAEQPVAERARVAALDLPARRLDQRPVLHS